MFSRRWRWIERESHQQDGTESRQSVQGTELLSQNADGRWSASAGAGASEPNLWNDPDIEARNRRLNDGRRLGARGDSLSRLINITTGKGQEELA